MKRRPRICKCKPLDECVSGQIKPLLYLDDIFPYVDSCIGLKKCYGVYLVIAVGIFGSLLYILLNYKQPLEEWTQCVGAFIAVAVLFVSCWLLVGVLTKKIYIIKMVLWLSLLIYIISFLFFIMVACSAIVKGNFWLSGKKFVFFVLLLVTLYLILVVYSYIIELDPLKYEYCTCSDEEEYPEICNTNNMTVQCYPSCEIKPKLSAIPLCHITSRQGISTLPCYCKEHYSVTLLSITTNETVEEKTKPVCFCRIDDPDSRGQPCRCPSPDQKQKGLIIHEDPTKDRTLCLCPKCNLDSSRQTCRCLTLDRKQIPKIVNDEPKKENTLLDVCHKHNSESLEEICCCLTQDKKRVQKVISKSRKDAIRSVCICSHHDLESARQTCTCQKRHKRQRGSSMMDNSRKDQMNTPCTCKDLISIVEQEPERERKVCDLTTKTHKEDPDTSSLVFSCSDSSHTPYKKQFKNTIIKQVTIKNFWDDKTIPLCTCPSSGLLSTSKQPCTCPKSVSIPDTITEVKEDATSLCICPSTDSNSIEQIPQKCVCGKQTTLPNITTGIGEDKLINSSDSPTTESDDIENSQLDTPSHTESPEESSDLTSKSDSTLSPSLSSNAQETKENYEETLNTLTCSCPTSDSTGQPCHCSDLDVTNTNTILKCFCPNTDSKAIGQPCHCSSPAKSQPKLDDISTESTTYQCYCTNSDSRSMGEPCHCSNSENTKVEASYLTTKTTIKSECFCPNTDAKHIGKPCRCSNLFRTTPMSNELNTDTKILKNTKCFCPTTDADSRGKPCRCGQLKTQQIQTKVTGNLILSNSKLKCFYPTLCSETIEIECQYSTPSSNNAQEGNIWPLKCKEKGTLGNCFTKQTSSIKIPCQYPNPSKNINTSNTILSLMKDTMRDIRDCNTEVSDSVEKPCRDVTSDRKQRDLNKTFDLKSGTVKHTRFLTNINSDITKNTCRSPTSLVKQTSSNATYYLTPEKNLLQCLCPNQFSPSPDYSPPFPHIEQRESNETYDITTENIMFSHYANQTSEYIENACDCLNIDVKDRESNEINDLRLDETVREYDFSNDDSIVSPCQCSGSDMKEQNVTEIADLISDETEAPRFSENIEAEYKNTPLLFPRPNIDESEAGETRGLLFEVPCQCTLSNFDNQNSSVSYDSSSEEQRIKSETFDTSNEDSFEQPCRCANSDLTHNEITQTSTVTQDKTEKQSYSKNADSEFTRKPRGYSTQNIDEFQSNESYIASSETAKCFCSNENSDSFGKRCRCESLNEERRKKAKSSDIITRNKTKPLTFSDNIDSEFMEKPRRHPMNDIDERESSERDEDALRDPRYTGTKTDRNLVFIDNSPRYRSTKKEMEIPRTSNLIRNKIKSSSFNQNIESEVTGKQRGYPIDNIDDSESGESYDISLEEQTPKCFCSNGKLDSYGKRCRCKSHDIRQNKKTKPYDLSRNEMKNSSFGKNIDSEIAKKPRGYPMENISERESNEIYEDSLKDPKYTGQKTEDDLDLIDNSLRYPNTNVRHKEIPKSSNLTRNKMNSPSLNQNIESEFTEKPREYPMEKIDDRESGDSYGISSEEQSPKCFCSNGNLDFYGKICRCKRLDIKPSEKTKPFDFSRNEIKYSTFGKNNDTEIIEKPRAYPMEYIDERESNERYEDSSKNTRYTGQETKEEDFDLIDNSLPKTSNLTRNKIKTSSFNQNIESDFTEKHRGYPIENVNDRESGEYYDISSEEQTPKCFCSNGNLDSYGKKCRCENLDVKQTEKIKSTDFTSNEIKTSSFSKNIDSEFKPRANITPNIDDHESSETYDISSEDQIPKCFCSNGKLSSFGKSCRCKSLDLKQSENTKFTDASRKETTRRNVRKNIQSEFVGNPYGYPISDIDEHDSSETYDVSSKQIAPKCFCRNDNLDSLCRCEPLNLTLNEDTKLFDPSQKETEPQSFSQNIESEFVGKLRGYSIADIDERDSSETYGLSSNEKTPKCFCPNENSDYFGKTCRCESSDVNQSEKTKFSNRSDRYRNEIKPGTFSRNVNSEFTENTRRYPIVDKDERESSERYDVSSEQQTPKCFCQKDNLDSLCRCETLDIKKSSEKTKLSDLSRNKPKQRSFNQNIDSDVMGKLRTYPIADSDEHDSSETYDAFPKIQTPKCFCPNENLDSFEKMCRCESLDVKHSDTKFYVLSGNEQKQGSFNHNIDSKVTGKSRRYPDIDERESSETYEVSSEKQRPKCFCPNENMDSSGKTCHCESLNVKQSEKTKFSNRPNRYRTNTKPRSFIHNVDSEFMDKSRTYPTADIDERELIENYEISAEKQTLKCFCRNDNLDSLCRCESLDVKESEKIKFSDIFGNKPKSRSYSQNIDSEFMGKLREYSIADIDERDSSDTYDVFSKDKTLKCFCPNENLDSFGSTCRCESLDINEKDKANLSDISRNEQNHRNYSQNMDSEFIGKKLRFPIADTGDRRLSESYEDTFMDQRCRGRKTNGDLDFFETLHRYPNTDEKQRNISNRTRNEMKPPNFSHNITNFNGKPGYPIDRFDERESSENYDVSSEEQKLKCFCPNENFGSLCRCENLDVKQSEETKFSDPSKNEPIPRNFSQNIDAEVMGGKRRYAIADISERRSSESSPGDHRCPGREISRDLDLFETPHRFRNNHVKQNEKTKTSNLMRNEMKPQRFSENINTEFNGTPGITRIDERESSENYDVSSEEQKLKCFCPNENVGSLCRCENLDVKQSEETKFSDPSRNEPVPRNFSQNTDAVVMGGKRRYAKADISERRSSESYKYTPRDHRCPGREISRDLDLFKTPHRFRNNHVKQNEETKTSNLMRNEMKPQRFSENINTEFNGKPGYRIARIDERESIENYDVPSEKQKPKCFCPNQNFDSLCHCENLDQKYRETNTQGDFNFFRKTCHCPNDNCHLSYLCENGKRNKRQTDDLHSKIDKAELACLCTNSDCHSMGMRCPCMNSDIKRRKSDEIHLSTSNKTLISCHCKDTETDAIGEPCRCSTDSSNTKDSITNSTIETKRTTVYNYQGRAINNSKSDTHKQLDLPKSNEIIPNSMPEIDSLEGPCQRANIDKEITETESSIDKFYLWSTAMVDPSSYSTTLSRYRLNTEVDSSREPCLFRTRETKFDVTFSINTNAGTNNEVAKRNGNQTTFKSGPKSAGLITKKYVSFGDYIQRDQ